jgi:Ca2+-binding EF-hand superfamily protein
MKTSLPVIFLSLAVSTIAYADIYTSQQDNDIEAAISTTLFTKVDVDKDGKVTFDEIYNYRIKEDKKRDEAQAQELFTKCDKNKDGKVGASELKVISFESVDFGANGKPDECSVPKEVIEMMDENGDGFLTKKEVMAMTANRGRPPKKIRERIEKQAEKRREKYQKEQFKRCDKDNDNFLTLREAASMRCSFYTEKFDAQDKNGDELISLKEMMMDVEPIQFENDLVDDGGMAGGIPDGSHLDARSVERQMPPLVKLQIRMSTCDKNDNGKLEMSETAGKKCSIDITFFNSVDHNGDSVIDDSEVNRVRMKQTFDELDSNHDGWLDKKEFKGSRIRYM